MKKIFLSSVALLSLTAGAMAADLPSRRAAPAPIVAAVPVFTWTGFYVGVNAGYGWVTSDRLFDPLFGYVGGNNDGGFVGGGQIGYNYQIGSFVLGLEGDIQYADLGDRFRFNTVTGLYEKDNSNDWFGTVRARAGVAFDRALVYATGGFAFANDNTGWTVGGGVEYAFTPNLSAKIEGLYVNVENDNRFRVGVAGDDNTEFGVVRAGLNYRFGTY